MYFVIKREKCETCQGEGYILNPSWEEFDKWIRKQKEVKGHPPTDKEVEEYMAENGLGAEPEEMVCPDCKGNRYIQCEVSLMEALKDVLGVKDDGAENGN